MPRDGFKELTAEQEFDRLTMDQLKPLVTLLGETPAKRKNDYVAVLVKAMTDPVRLRTLYEQLDPLMQLAVREATHDPDGYYSRVRFIAKYGKEPDWKDPAQKAERWFNRYANPTSLVLFFPNPEYLLPTDVWAILRSFVAPPERFSIRTLAELPTEYRLTQPSWVKDSGETVPLRVRETAREAEADLPAMLRLIDAGKVRVTDKKLAPTEATRKAVAGMLTGGDFYTPDDADKHDYEVAHDIAIKAYAWPMLIQAAGLAEKRGDTLKLTPAGRNALAQEPAEVLGKVWTAWLKTKLLDEFSRIDVIKGQTKARLSAVADRRKVVREVLKECPPGEWFAVDDFWRVLRATDHDIDLVDGRELWKLYLFSQQHGSFGYENSHTWEQLDGRFILAFLFEYAATLGLLDVGYVPPQDARADFYNRWGADDLSCLSRYDGLIYLRINPLGAYLLGLKTNYQPAIPRATQALRVLANLDVVAQQPLPSATQFTLERFADETSSQVWKLSAAKILAVIERGGRLLELREFLATHAANDLPQTVETFLNDLQHKAEQLRDGGPARILECASAHVALELANDRQLKGKCLLAGDRLIVREGDLSAVRKAIRRLGYVWPMVGE